jgi:hypothetical protein
MAIANKDKDKNYVRYAMKCLEMVAVAPDQESRSIQREMAAEWLNLANSVPRRSRSKPRQMA